MNKWIACIGLSALLGIGGCAVRPGAGEGDMPTLIRVPLVRQATDHTCGVASLQSILGYYGIDCREDLLASGLRVTDHARISEIEHYMTGQGFTVTMHPMMSLAELKQLLARGTPVMVCLQAWEKAGTTLEQYRKCQDSGHWVVVVGSDARNIYVMDPSTLGNYAFVPIDEFMARWHDEADGQRYRQFGITFATSRPPVFRPDAIPKME